MPGTFEGGESGKPLSMRVFVAGASGAIGSRLVPQLVEQGHLGWTLRYPSWRAGFAAAYGSLAPGRPAGLTS